MPRKAILERRHRSRRNQPEGSEILRRRARRIHQFARITRIRAARSAALGGQPA